MQYETDTADEVEFDTERRSYYVREELGWGWLTGVPHLNPVDTDQAQTEIQSCVLEPQTLAGRRLRPGAQVTVIKNLSPNPSPFRRGESEQSGDNVTRDFENLSYLIPLSRRERG